MKILSSQHVNRLHALLEIAAEELRIDAQNAPRPFPMGLGNFQENLANALDEFREQLRSAGAWVPVDDDDDLPP